MPQRNSRDLRRPGRKPAESLRLIATQTVATTCPKASVAPCRCRDSAARFRGDLRAPIVRAAPPAGTGREPRRNALRCQPLMGSRPAGQRKPLGIEPGDEWMAQAARCHPGAILGASGRVGLLGDKCCGCGHGLLRRQSTRHQPLGFRVEPLAHGKKLLDSAQLGACLPSRLFGFLDLRHQLRGEPAEFVDGESHGGQRSDWACILQAD